MLKRRDKPYDRYRSAGISHLMKGDYEAAIENSVEWQDSETFSYSPTILLMSAYALAGDVGKAKQQLSELHATYPSTIHYTVPSYSDRFPFRNPEHVALLESGLRKAGVADRPE